MQFLALSNISSTVSLSSHMLTLLKVSATLLSVPLRYSMDMSKSANAATHLWPIASRLGCGENVRERVIRPDDEGAVLQVLTELLNDGPLQSQEL